MTNSYIQTPNAIIYCSLCCASKAKTKKEGGGGGGGDERLKTFFEHAKVTKRLFNIINLKHYKTCSVFKPWCFRRFRRFILVLNLLKNLMYYFRSLSFPIISVSLLSWFMKKNFHSGLKIILSSI